MKNEIEYFDKIDNLPFGFKTIPSKKDNRTIKHKHIKVLGTPLLVKGGIEYLKEDIESQHKVGICTGISMTQNRAKTSSIALVSNRLATTGKKYSADFQYLLQKKFIDKDWEEGSSILSTLKVGKNYGFLQTQYFTYVTEADRYLSYEQYIMKLQAISDTEILRLLSLCEDKIAGYVQVNIKDPNDMAEAINDSTSGILCMYLVGKEWYTSIAGMSSYLEKDISPLRYPKKYISGHAITMSSYDYTTQYKQTLANTWGKEWCRNGSADLVWDNYKPIEAWLITESPLVHKFMSDLKFGTTSNEIKNLQIALKLKGYFAFNITGYFGIITLLAVKAFQKANNIITTGFVGPLTRSCLNNLFNL